MNQVKKLWILMLLATCGLAIANEKAPTPYQSGFYAGLSTGFAQLQGQRSEKITVGPGDIFTVSDGTKMRDNGIQSNLFIGYLWRMFETQFVIAPELYLGYGPLKDRLRKTGEDQGGFNITFDGSVERKGVYGAVIRAGSVIYDSHYIYLIGGVELSHFNISPTFSHGGAVGSIEAQSKNSTAVVYGMGFEKQLGKFRIALEPKISAFQKKNFTFNFSTGESLAGSIEPRILTVMLKVSLAL